MSRDISMQQLLLRRHVAKPASWPADRPAAWGVALWLFLVAGLVLLMVTVGGATRLTGSGLSITEWQPILGAIPPLTEGDWMTAFDKYRQIAQYKLINKGMSLDAFKFIYWWEWGHRQLGRFIGLAYGLPFLAFALAGRIPKGLMPKLLGLLVLGGLQGAMGWYMVQSGLTDRVSVSQYRLAAHLTLAAILFAGLLWTALEALGHDRVRLRTLGRGAAPMSGILVGLVLAQITLGAFVAGTNAGLSHNTWPLMDGRIAPSGLLSMSPAWLNAFENVATIQFNHRMLAYTIAALALWQGWRTWATADDEHVRGSGLLLALGVFAQVVIGIWTLLAMVPLWLGLVHQAMAFVMLGVAVWHRHAVGRQTQ
jgi:heme a synthase